MERIDGQLPRTQQRLVEAWAEIHRVELAVDWKLLPAGRPPHKIDAWPNTKAGSGQPGGKAADHGRCNASRWTRRAAPRTDPGR